MGSQPERGSTIFQKLAGLIVIVTAVIVAALAVYFPVRQLQESRARLNLKAANYGRLVSMQLRSAVGFEDRETAREVLAGVAQDPEVIGQAVVLADGTVLEALGRPSPRLVATAGQHGAAPIVHDDRIAVTAPIGPSRGRAECLSSSCRRPGSPPHVP